MSSNKLHHVSDVLGRARELTEPAYRAAVDRLPEPLRHIVGYHVGWWDVAGLPTSPRDKGIRPALAVLSAGAVPGGSASMGIAAAVAVQLVHDFSLLHDDIMDEDSTRRHRAAAWSVFGAGPALLAGDALHALAVQVVFEADGHNSAQQARILSSTLWELCLGQAADYAFEDRASVTLAECLQMAERKTATLLGCACEIGALAGGADGRRAAAARSFGRRLGMAFQLRDDILGIWGDPEATGKPVRADLTRRKKSLPVLVALTSHTAAGRELAELLGREGELSPIELVRVADLVDAAGGRAWAQRMAASMIDQALGDLEGARLQTDAAADLASIARLVLERNR
jgi:geranylgeranyl diphosphate synthase type I